MRWTGLAPWELAFAFPGSLTSTFLDPREAYQPLFLSIGGAFRFDTRGNVYRGTSLVRNRHLLGPYSRPMARALWWSQGGGSFLWARYPLMGEVPLYRIRSLLPVW